MGTLDAVTRRFSLGTITVKDDAALALQWSGQEASFFLEKHQNGDWGNAEADTNEKGLVEGTLVLSRYRTLFGHDLHVLTFLKTNETVLFCPPDSVIEHVPLPDLACWYPGGKRPGDEEMKPNYGELFVHSTDMGGWVRLHTDKHNYGHPELHVILSAALTDWFRARPQFRLRCVVPIQRDGTTVEFHAWFDAHIFPPTVQAPPQIKQ